MAQNFPKTDSRKIEPDSLLDGRLLLHQWDKGHRVGTDAILLAAAAPPIAKGLVVDVGAGVGAVGLILARANTGVEVALLEKNPEAAELSRQNAAANDLSSRIRVFEADLFDVPARKAGGLVEAADLVVTNPPFLNSRTARASPDAARAMAHMLDEGGIAKWLQASLALLKPRGMLVLIHRADALEDLLAGLGGRLGGLEILPVFPRRGEKATRLILRGRKGGKAPLALLPGLVLHETDGGFTLRAEQLHREGARLFEP
jgi:tRNA1(Val) A37 N6-methylase TrmN6